MGNDAPIGGRHLDERVYWIWLQRALGVGGTRIPAVLRAFQTAKAFYEAGASAWEGLGILTQREKELLHTGSLQEAGLLLNRCAALGQTVLTPETPGYPERLRAIYHPPCVLYVQGKLPDMDRCLSIAIVGSRTASHAALHTAGEISGALARNGVVVVSGGAHGVDHAVHEAALSAGGVTVSVLPCGIDYPYLPEYAELREMIAASGALVSEYPPGTGVQKWNFRTRNRLLSGLSSGVLIAEAAKRSGTMITARYALEQNRDVFVIPANVGPESEGSNGLLRSGAKAVLAAEDVLDEYAGRDYEQVLPQEAPAQMARPAAQDAKALFSKEFSADAETVYRVLGKTPLTIGEVAAATGLSAQRLFVALTELEIEQKIQSLAGRRYVRIETA